MSAPMHDLSVMLSVNLNIKHMCVSVGCTLCYIYISFTLHEHDLQFHARDIEHQREKDKDNADATSKDYATIRKLAHGRDEPNSHSESQSVSIRSATFVRIIGPWPSRGTRTQFAERSAAE